MMKETTPNVSKRVTAIAASHNHHSRRSVRRKFFLAASEEPPEQLCSVPMDAECVLTRTWKRQADLHIKKT
jgi:hypothetical protein